jgi:putative spermidine/putrescine transport system ATP-binding protein
VALDDVSLDIAPGEFVSLLGPSGSGKTTLLGILGGFVQPSSGAVWVGERDITFAPPHKRDIGIVFQNYALFPHMTVGENVAFPLRARRQPKSTWAKKVADALAMVELSGYENRGIGQLSGGQRQRVALARAMVFEPQLILMDEPLSALDKQLRETMQIELRRLHRKLGATIVYVTHDQREALTMSDRVAVMDSGRIQQLGSPFEIYERPATEFVAGFIGVSNLVERDGRQLTIRPEKVHLLFEGDVAPEGAHVEPGEITEVIYLGVVTRFVVALDGGGSLVAVRQNLETAAADALESQGARVKVAWRPDQAYEIASGTSPEETP